MVSYLIANLVHPFFCFYFVILQKESINGIAFAGLATNIVNLLILVVGMSFDKEMVEAMSFPDSRSFKNIGSFLVQSVPNTIILFIDYWAWE